MTDINKITKGITLTPEMVETVDGWVQENDTSFTHEVAKCINLRKSLKEREHGPEGLTDNLHRIPQYWMREQLYVLQDILDEIRDMRAKQPKSKED